MRKIAGLFSFLFILFTTPCLAWWQGFNQGDLKIERTSIDFDEQSSDPVAPGTNHIKLYAKDDSGTTKLFIRNSAGDVTDLSADALSTFVANLNSDSFSDDQFYVADNSSGGTPRTMPNCPDSAGNHINYTQSTNEFSCGTTTGITGGWTYSTPNITLATSSDVVGIGGSPLGKLSVTGSTDITQLMITFDDVQTALGVIFQKSDGTDLYTWSNDGTYTQTGSATNAMSLGGGVPATYPITFGLSGSNDPVLTASDGAWKWAAASEDMTCTFSSNTLTCASSTGVTALAYTSIGVTGALSSTTSIAGLTEAAIASEVNTGTDAARAVTPDALAGSNLGTKIVQVTAFDYTTNTAVGDGAAYYIIPAEMTGMNLVTVRAEVITAGTTNATNVDIARCAAAASGNLCSGTVSDVLSTNITIDSGENSTTTAAAAAVIDTGNDDVTTGQAIRVDVDVVSTTPAKGLIVTMVFQLP